MFVAVGRRRQVRAERVCADGDDAPTWYISGKVCRSICCSNLKSAVPSTHCAFEVGMKHSPWLFAEHMFHQKGLTVVESALDRRYTPTGFKRPSFLLSSEPLRAFLAAGARLAIAAGTISHV